MATFQEISDTALAQLNAVYALADGYGQEAMGYISSLATTTNSLLTSLAALVYSPEFLVATAVTYTTPDEPTADSDPAVPSLDDLSGQEPLYEELSGLNSKFASGSVIPELSYTEAPYTELVKTETTTLLTSVLGGNSVLADAVWTAMYDRMVADFGDQQVAEEWAASDLGASNGWSLPSETTLARLDAAENQTSRRISEARLEKFLQESTQKREDAWNSVQHGVGFEQIWQQHHKAVQDRSLSAAIAQIDALVASNERLFTQYRIWTEQDKLLVEQDRIRVSQDNVRVAWGNALIAKNSTLIQLYMAEWGELTKRISATAHQYQARIAAAQLELSKYDTQAKFDAIELERGVKTADGKAQLNLGQVSAIVEQGLQSITASAQLAGSLAQAALSASDVNVGSSADIGLNENYNYAKECCEDH